MCSPEVEEVGIVLFVSPRPETWHDLGRPRREQIVLIDGTGGISVSLLHGGRCKAVVPWVAQQTDERLDWYLRCFACTTVRQHVVAENVVVPAAW